MPAIKLEVHVARLEYSSWPGGTRGRCGRRGRRASLHAALEGGRAPKEWSHADGRLPARFSRSFFLEWAFC